MSKLSERIKEYLQELEINQLEFSRRTGIQHSNISDFLNEKHTPSYKNFVKLLYEFNCSADYLLGISDIHTEETLYPVFEFSTRFREVLKINHVSQERLKRELNVSGSVLYKWLTGKSLPSIDYLIILAKYFHYSVDYLLGRVR